MNEKSIQINDTSKKSVFPIDFKKIKDSFSLGVGKEYLSKLILGVAVLSVCITLYFLYSLYATFNTLSTKTPSLINLNRYDLTALSANASLSQTLSAALTFDDLISKNDEIKNNIQKYKDYLRDLQIPYENFLKYVYLPSLNVWRDNYTKQVDTGMIGAKFLNQNPYNDLILTQKWSDFFKNVGDNNEFNDISDISVGAIAEASNGYFSLPITVSFVANSKRSFLMLVDKLSTTSNKNNISLINEFFYYLWQEIKKQKKTEIQNLVLVNSGDLGSGNSEDAYIGYDLYNWIFKDATGTLIDSGVLDATIKNLMTCTSITDHQCYYQFREKYRDISTFAYAISKDINVDAVSNFKKFFKSFPPVLEIKNFTFDKVTNNSTTDFSNMKYQGTVTIDVYGKGILQEEVDQIATVLGKQCFKEDKSLSVALALDMVSNFIAKQSDIIGTDKSKIDNSRELKGVLDTITTEYPNLSNYKKIIRLFEVRRMLDDSSLCE